MRWIKAATGLSQERIARLVGVSRQTMNLWDRGKPISSDNRRRLFGVRDVLERAAIKHQSPGELQAWLDTPRGTDGLTPAQVLERGEIGRARTLAISAPSAGLQRAASWANRPVPEPFKAGAERRTRQTYDNQHEGLTSSALDDTDLEEDVETLMDE